MLGEGVIFSLGIAIVIAGLLLFKLYSYFKKKNPVVSTQSMAYLYGELSRYDPNLLTSFQNLEAQSKVITLADLLHIRNLYANGMTNQKLNELMHQQTEESQYLIDQYNYSLSLLDELIHKTKNLA